MIKDPNASMVKDPYVKTHFKTDKELNDFVKCCDPVTGYLYFMDNFFMIQHSTKGSMHYHPYEYQRRLIDTYHNNRYSIALMPRQTGKCVSGKTMINIRNDLSGKTYEIPIGIYYEWAEATRNGQPGPDISSFETKKL